MVPKRTLWLALLLGCAKVAKPPGKPELQGPQVAILWPGDGDTVRDTVVVRVYAFDSSGVAVVGLRVDGEEVGVDSTSPYEIPWDTRELYDTEHVLRAWALDRWDNPGESPGVRVLTRNGNPPPPDSGKKSLK